jgi:rsbT co-antagonist protein RsbR
MTEDPAAQGQGNIQRITVNQAPFEWELDRGALSFFGIPSVLFWLNPSLLRMLTPLVHEAGVPLARLLIAWESSQGTEEDYHAMVTQLASSFVPGFLAWGKAVGAAGWGSFSVPLFDPANHRAIVKVTHAWELKMQAGSGELWGCPFLQGKIIGIFSHALGVNCWADECNIDRTPGVESVEFHIYRSPNTIASELEKLRSAHREQKEQALKREIEMQTQGLRQVEANLQTVLRNSPGVIYILDREARVIVLEGKQLQQLGMPRTVAELYPGQDVSSEIVDVLAGEERRWDSECAGVYLSTHGVPLRNDAGVITGMLGICIDITARVKAEQQLNERKAALESELHQQQQSLVAMSTPVISLWEGILLLPLVGSVDQARAMQFMQSLLDSISIHHAREIIIDITGMPFVDSQVASYLIKSVQAARLLGAHCILVGISPEVAQTLVHLGADLNQISTYSTLASGLREALSRQQLAIVASTDRRAPRSR